MNKAMTAALPPVPTCIVIYTGSSCQTQSEVGGHAAILCRYIDGELAKRMDRTGGDAQTTNNRMDMVAVIEGLKQIKLDEALPIFIVCGAQIIVRGMTEWLPGWIAKGWCNGKGEKIGNVDLWQEIIELCNGLNVTFLHASGHSGGPLQEEAHRLAVKARGQRKTRNVKFIKGEPA
ncbi:ribonuclease HI [Rhodobacter viridis]|uniref:ribonuclease H n=2 Tax=Rhodobacter viridis TaxID=1054202 RepID=A0A318U6F4_9RHOB|nr:ribonuclease HI [Rhodobacter viridis]